MGKLYFYQGVNLLGVGGFPSGLSGCHVGQAHHAFLETDIGAAEVLVGTGYMLAGECQTTLRLTGPTTLGTTKLASGFVTRAEPP